MDVDSQTSTTLHLTVHGVATGPGQAPFYLVLGESVNAGWKAVGDGRAAASGPPVLIDGFANGWRIDPSSLGPAVHDGTLSVVLTWQPQTRVDSALIVSAVAIVACVVLALVPVRRRRRRRGLHARSAGSTATVPAPVMPAPVAAAVPATVAAGTAPGGGEAAAAESAGGGGHPAPGTVTVRPAEVDEGPHLAVPFRGESPRAAVWVALVTGVVTGVVAGSVSAPKVGLAVGAASAVVLLVPRLRIFLGLAAVAGIAAAGWYTAAHQAALHVPADGSWPLSFQTASDLAWAGVVFLGADAVVEVVLRRRRRPRRGRRAGDDGPVA